MSTASVSCEVGSLGCPSWLVLLFMSVCPSLALGVVRSQVCGPTCSSCVLGSSGVSVVPFCRLGLWSHPLPSLVPRWVSSFGVCWPWVGRLRSCLGSCLLLVWNSPSLVLVVFAWRFLRCGCPGSLSFSCTLSWGSSSRFQFLLIARAGCGWSLVFRPPWLGGGVCSPGFLLGSCWLALVGLRCLWVTQSCSVHGLRDGVTGLKSGLCSSSVLDRHEVFLSFWWVWFLALVRVPLPQAGAVFLGMR